MIASGPFGLILVGIESDQNENITWDCWKQIVHDESDTPSNGKQLKSLIEDQRVKQVKLINDLDHDFTILILKNIWNEEFRIDFFIFPNKKVAAHANKLNKLNLN
jgi:hypothetical protein